MDDAPKTYIIEDDASVLASVCALLESCGRIAQGFTSAEEFLRSAALDEIGCVVTDLQMPGMDGGQLQEALEQRESCFGVVVVTGYADVPATVALMSRGAVTVIEKPYKSSTLLQAVDDAIQRSRSKHARKCERREFDAKLSQLTDEEYRILRRMIAGRPIKAIAHDLGISKRTVDRRRSAILQRMQVSSIGELGLLMAGRSANWADSDAAH